MSACFQAYRSDPVVSDWVSSMLNDGAISAVQMMELFQQCILLKHAVVSEPWGWNPKGSEYVKFQFRCIQWSITQSQQLC